MSANLHARLSCARLCKARSSAFKRCASSTAVAARSRSAFSQMFSPRDFLQVAQELPGGLCHATRHHAELQSCPGLLLLLLLLSGNGLRASELLQRPLHLYCRAVSISLYMQDRLLEPRRIYIVGFASSTTITSGCGRTGEARKVAHTSLPTFFQSSGSSPSAATMHVCTLA